MTILEQIKWNSKKYKELTKPDDQKNDLGVVFSNPFAANMTSFLTWRLEHAHRRPQV